MAAQAKVPDKRHTLGIAALQIGVQAHHLQRLCTRGQIPHEKIGRLHVVNESDFDTIREVCRQVGYLSSGRIAASAGGRP